MHLTAKFHHPTFSRSEVIVRTNKHTDKQTPLKTSTALHYATPVGNNVDIVAALLGLTVTEIGTKTIDDTR